MIHTNDNTLMQHNHVLQALDVLQELEGNHRFFFMIISFGNIAIN